MIIDVILKPNSSVQKVEKEGLIFKVYVKSSPHDGKANAEMLKLLSEKFDISISRFEIVQGFKSPNKRVKILHNDTTRN